MDRFAIILILFFGLPLNAAADIWKWVDVQGETHYVDTNTPIYTWVDESGKVHYSDKPEHEDAVSVVLVWYSKGNLDAAGEVADTGRDKEIDPDESVEDRLAREAAEAYYCKRATEIYETYVNAPRLFKTNANGEREYLSDEDVEATLTETRARVDELCE